MFPWYAAGAIAINNGGTTVTGTGTEFIGDPRFPNAGIGQGLYAPDGRIYPIASVVSNTQLTLGTPYLGGNVTGASYAILPFRGLDSVNAALIADLLSSFQSVRDGIGAGLMSDGTVSLPGLRFSADQDTGIWRSGSNAMALVTGGVARLALDGSGGVGVGTSTTPGRFNVALAGSRSLGSAWDAASVLIGTPGQFSGNLGLSFDTTNGATIESGAPGVATYPIRLAASQIQFLTASTERLQITDIGVVRPGSDNAQSLGTASFRWSTIFAGNGTIQTSDAREKVWRGLPEEAATRAANRIIGELGFFQWADAVEEKGEDGARVHFGVRAQEVIRIMMEEGLEDEQKFDFASDKFIKPKDRPSFRHGFLCFDTWEAEVGPEIVETGELVEVPTGLFAEDGRPMTRAVEIRFTGETGRTIQTRPAGNRFGLRIDQLTMFLLAALASRVAALEIKETI